MIPSNIRNLNLFISFFIFRHLDMTSCKKVLKKSNCLFCYFQTNLGEGSCCYCYCHSCSCYPEQKKSQLLVPGLRLEFDNILKSSSKDLVCIFKLSSQLPTLFVVGIKTKDWINLAEKFSDKCDSIQFLWNLISKFIV